MKHNPGESRAIGTAQEPPAENRGAVVERVFREHNEILIRFLQTRLPSAQDAREVAQEAYVRLLQLEQPEAIGFLRAYLFKIASHIATDRLRHRQVRQNYENSESFDFMGVVSPMDTLAAQQDLDVVNAALDELPPKCRKVFLMRRLGDMDTEEVARREGIGGRMVRLYVAQALLHCHRSLQRAHALRGEAANDPEPTGE
jgi:RNA polymerase sigma-70 factor (ECF subfamily)